MIDSPSSTLNLIMPSEPTPPSKCASDESALAAAVVEEEVVRDFALEKLDPTQRVFADRVLAWGRELLASCSYRLSTTSGHRPLQPQAFHNHAAATTGHCSHRLSTTMRPQVISDTGFPCGHMPCTRVDFDVLLLQ